MKQETRFMKRSLALLLVAVMVLSNLSGLTLPARAAGDSEELTYGEIVAGNYDLTAAEKALLESKLLVGESITFNAPTDSSRISVDNEEKTITVATYTDDEGNKWVPTKVLIVYNGGEELVTLTNGEGTYVYNGNAFSVKVTYTLFVDIDTATQQNLLNASGWLKQGIANLDAVSGQSGNLYILEQAMPSLVDLADNGASTPMGPVTLDPGPRASIYALRDQMDANGGRLNLSVMIEELESGAKSDYMLNKGVTMQTEIASLMEDLNEITAAVNDICDALAMFINNGWLEETADDQVQLLKGTCENLIAGLETVNADPWYAAKNHADIVIAEADYAKLDTLVAALGEQTNVEIKESLTVATAEVQLNMSMFDVTVKVVLNTVQNNVVKPYAEKEIILTLAKDATAAEILAEIAAKGIENSAKAEWAGVYVAEHFEATNSGLPATLTKDITYTITYSPKYYTVTSDYAAAQSLPYGYELTLPRHENPAEAYDYKVNGVSYAQGTVYTIVGDTNITRTAGKAYTTYDLYAIIADNYANNVLANIMTSGALKDNAIVNVRKPDPADAESLVTLKNGYLTAKPVYESDYAGLAWVPYSYGAEGTENLFNGSITVEWTGGSVKVQYKLVLKNHSADKVQGILNNMVSLKTEANAQKSTLDSLAGNYDVMGQLDKTKLGALNGVIDVTDFTPGDGVDTDAKNMELRAYFKSVVSSIIANNLDGNVLKIYNMLGAYLNESTGGLTYYYNNSAAVIAEINSLSGYLTALMEEEEALKIMVSAAGYPEYAEKIKNLEQSMANVKAALTAPNALIDLESPNLYKLIDALEAAGDAAYETYGSPYLLSDALTALDETTAIVQVIVDVNGQTKTFTTAEMAPGAVLEQSVVDTLIAQVEAFAAEQLGAKLGFYDVTGIDELRAMAGQTVSSGSQSLYVSYTATEYTIVIDGMNKEFVVNINNLSITLPAHETAGYVYVYTVFDREVTVGQEAAIITLTAEELGKIENGTYTITWTDYNKAEADTVGKLDTMVNELKNALGSENVTLSAERDVLTVNMGATQLMDFVMTLVTNGGYSYYGLNGDGLIYMNEESTLQLSMQAMINAITYDDSFSTNSLVALGNNGKGKLFSASLQLGDSASVLDYEDIELVVNLSSVPSQMQTALSALDAMKGYLNFYSDNGVLEVELNLPDQVYGAYLTALVATGNVEKSDINAINQEIAFQFLCDYLDAVIKSNGDLTSLQNTLSALGQKMTLEQYNGYYKMLSDSLTYEVLAENGGMNIGLNFEGKSTIDSLLNVLGAGDSFDSYKGMIAEYKSGVFIDIPAHATLKNVEYDYCALILDAQASGITNKFECIRTDNVAELQKELSTLAGYSVVILLDDVAGDLTVSGTTILDLNGYNVSGDIAATGKLFIIDSSMDTYNAGTVEGNVSGSVTVVAGNYTSDVTAFLKDGYYMDGTTVRNALYYIESDEKGNVTFVVNSDVYKSEEVNGYVPNAKVLALDIATDLLLNYITTAGMTVDGNNVYDVDFQNLIDMLETRAEAAENVIDALLATVSFEGISNVTNTIIADLLNFGAIHDALENGTNVAEYEMTLAPWMVEVEHVEEEDYFTVNIQSNKELAKTFTLALRIEGDSIDYVKNLAGELSQIVEENTEITINIEEPKYDNKDFWISAAGSAIVSVNMSENVNYAKALAIILAYGNPNKVDAVVAGINDMAALKNVVDNTTVAELFKALKAMNRSTDLLAMAKAIGLNTADLSDAAALEKVYHLSLVAAGKALEELEITGRDSKLVGLYNEETGYYELSKSNMFRDGELVIRSYSASYELSVSELSFSLKLFGEISGECKHSFTNYISNGDATCTEDGTKTAKCDNGCGETDTVVDEGSALGHSFTNYKSNGDATCTADGTKTAECDHGCGETKTVVDEGSALGHSDKVGDRDHNCDICGATDVSGHVYGDASCDLPAICIECGAVSSGPLGHSFTNYVSNGDATCTEDGTKTAKCDRCDVTDTIVDEGSALGHNTTDVPGKKPTCTETGLTDGYKCSVCGEVFIKQQEIPALGHSFGQWSVTKAATCTENGEEIRACDACGHTETRVIEATGHSFGQWTVTKAATCTEDGEETRTCACGETETRVIEATGHSFGQWTVTKAATCTEDGEEVRTCACGETESRKIAASGAHTFGQWTVTKAATCTEDGEETRTCACGETETRVIEATGEHTYGEWEVTKEATKKEEGEETRTCSLCGHTETRPIDKLESSFPWWIILVVLLGGGGAGVGGYFLLKKRKLF